MNHNNTEEKNHGTVINVAGTVLGLLAFATAKALADKETREKIMDTFFEIKQKLSESTKKTNESKLEEKKLL